MQHYENCLCDCCGKPFVKDDDIVICPVCGTPMHRLCYRQKGACPHESEHAAGFEWNFPATGAGAKVACPHCGAQNDPAASFCQLCEQPLAAQTADRGQAGPRKGGEWRDFYTFGGSRRVPEFDVENVSSEEMRDYLGHGAERFLQKFRMILSGSFSPAVWNLPALVFGPFYYFYRRMKKQGMILLLLLLAIYLPGYIYSVEFFKANLSAEMFGFTFAYSEALLRSLEPVAAVCSVLRFGLHIYCCIQANRHLLANVIADIRALHEQVPKAQRGEAAYRQTLAYRGAPTIGMAALAMLLFVTALYGITVFRLGAPVFPDGAA